MFSNTDLNAQLRSAWVAFIPELKPQLYCTVVYNKDISMARARNIMCEFHKQVDRKIFGPYHYNNPVNERVLFIAFPEKIETFLHFHLHVHVPHQKQAKFYLSAAKVWKKLCRGGLCKVDPLLHPRDVINTARYSTKQLFHSQNEEHIIVSTEFLQK